MKILSAESNIGTATTVSSATVVRLYNSDSSVGIVTRTDNSDTTIGNFTVPSGEVLYLQKKSTDKLVAPSTVLASKVAYSHMMSYASYTSSGGGGGGDNVVTDNMVVYLDAGNSSSYSGSGTAWNDVSGNSNNFTLINGPTYSSSDGGAIVFDGTNDYATSPSGVSYLKFGTNDYSYGVWAQFNSFADNASTLSTKQDNDLGSVNTNWQLDFGGAGGRFRHVFRHGASGQQIFESTTAASTGTWYYIFIVNDRSENAMRMYINGSLLSDGINYSTVYGTSTDVGNFDGFWRVGANRGLHTFTNGKIAQVHVYKGKALTASEVLQNYDASKSRYGY